MMKLTDFLRVQALKHAVACALLDAGHVCLASDCPAQREAIHQPVSAAPDQAGAAGPDNGSAGGRAVMSAAGAYAANAV